jgi:DNA-binding transcriptional regulator YhcF (GntR family)
MDSKTSVTDWLRDRIVGALHLGRLHTGDRLPSIRDLSQEFGADHRAVAQAYRVLEKEGLVEVRTRSGVYVAKQERLDGEMLAETARWMAGVLTEAWRRRITFPGLPELVRRCTAEVHLRCACVESSEDEMLAYCTELTEDFALECVPVYVGPDPPLDPATSEERGALREKLRDVDFVITTSYHFGLVHAAMEGMELPLVVLRINPDMVEIIRRRLRDHRLTVVATDHRFGDRIRSLYKDDAVGEGHLQVVLADDAPAVAALDRTEPVLMTRAAHHRIGETDLVLLVPHSPTFAPETARELSEIVIRLNMKT